MSNKSVSCLLVHGAGGGAWEWGLWTPLLQARGCMVRTLVLQAMPAGLVRTGFDDYVRQVGQALARLPRPRVVVGASLGGLLAARNAQAADGLVLVNPLPPAPWHQALPVREWADIVAWGRRARLQSTRHALADSDPATAIAAMRLWRDESGAVLREACAGVVVERPAVPVLCIVSRRDPDVPPELSRALASAWQADLLQAPSDTHVGPLLGACAVEVAGQAAGWMAARLG